MRKSELQKAIGQTVQWGNVHASVKVIEVRDDGVVVDFVDHPTFKGKHLVSQRDLHVLSADDPYTWKNVDRPVPV